MLDLTIVYHIKEIVNLTMAKWSKDMIQDVKIEYVVQVNVLVCRTSWLKDRYIYFVLYINFY